MTKDDLIKQLEDLADCSDTQNVDESRGYFMGVQAAIKIIKDADRLIFDKTIINNDYKNCKSR